MLHSEENNWVSALYMLCIVCSHLLIHTIMLGLETECE